MSEREDTGEIKQLAEELPGFLRMISVLLPPSNLSPKRLYFHLLRMTLLTCAVSWLVLLLTGMALGVPSSYFPGFATREDIANMEKQEAKVNSDQDASAETHWANELDTQIISLRKDQCRLEKAHNHEAAAAVYDKIRDRMADYERLTKHRYQLPNCGDV